VKLILAILMCLMSTLCIAGDVYVKGYYRSNGTYVSPHYRSAPDSTKTNNYGSASASSTSLYDRDSDGDGIYNQYDLDDNNDGYSDDYNYQSF